MMAKWDFEKLKREADAEYYGLDKTEAHSLQMTEHPAPKFKVGDVVEVVGDFGSGHCFEEGEVVTVTRLTDYGYYCQGFDEVTWAVRDRELKPLLTEADGGPAEYYDFPPNAITLNDLIEHKGMDFHRGNIFKACWRYGTKSGTTKEYDARKIIYSGARILMLLVGVAELRKTLQKMLDDPQFQEREK
jgi:hypothetical protein